jgi:undecaprenyl-diphosphatase
MTLIEAIIFGLVQGLSEFLPISSSGHLVLAKAIMGVKEPGMVFEIFVHFGTLIAVFVYFRDDVLHILSGLFATLMHRSEATTGQLAAARMAAFIVVGSIPAGLIGFLFKSEIEALFSTDNLAMVLVFLFITGLIMFLTRYMQAGAKELSQGKSFAIGLAQAFAILPGISRSGSTIGLGILLGLKREEAARFSFLLSLPVIFGATLKQFYDLFKDGLVTIDYFIPIAAATISAAVSGYLAIIWLMKIVRQGNLVYFAYYCWTIVLVGGLFLYL